MDLYAFGVLLLEAFFHPVARDSDGTYPSAKDIDWNRIRDGYELTESERKSLTWLVKELLEVDSAKPSKIDAEKAYSSAWFQSFPDINPEETYKFITQLLFIHNQPPAK
jgi:hypothetical protein